MGTAASKDGVFFPQYSVAMHSHLIKIIYTVISFLLWKALGTFLLLLPAYIFVRQAYLLSQVASLWTRGCSIHP